MQKNHINKIFTICIIVFFIGVSISSAISVDTKPFVKCEKQLDNHEDLSNEISESPMDLKENIICPFLIKLAGLFSNLHIIFLNLHKIFFKSLTLRTVFYNIFQKCNNISLFFNYLIDDVFECYNPY
jgi:hypothetical protein